MSPPDDQSQPALALDRRKAVIAVVAAVVLAGGAFTILSQLSHAGRFGSVIAQADKPLLPICVAGQLMAYLGYTFAYRTAARATGGPCFDYWTTARIVIFGAGTAILGASVGGLAVDFWALRRAGMEPQIAARRILAVGTLEWTVLSMYAFTAAVLVLACGIRAPFGMSLGWLLAIPICVGAAIWFSSPPRVQPLINPVLHTACAEASRARRGREWLQNKLRIGLADAIAGVVLVRHLISHPLRYYGAAVGYPIYWAGDILTLYAGVRAFGGSPNPASLVLAYATGFVISSLPLPAGGAGGVEATIALALHATGVPWTASLLGVFLYRLLTFWLPALPALALLPSIRRLSHQLRSVPHTRRDLDEGVSFRPSTKTSA